MLPPPPPRYPDEEARLAALRRYEILDTEYERAYDDLTRLAAELCDAPIAVINLIDRDRQWFKSHVGLAARETPLDVSICAHALLQPDVLVVPDTREDARFAANPLVTGEPGLRFYAGALLQSPDGPPVGTLCVLDYAPRAGGATERQKNVLRVLAREVTSQMELRLALREGEAARRALSASEERFRAVQETSPEGFMVFETVRDGGADGDGGPIRDFRWVYANEAAARIVGRPRDWFPGRLLLEEMPGNRDEGLFDAYARVVETGETWSREFAYGHDGVGAYLRATAAKAGDGFAVTFADISERRRADEALRESEARFRNMADHAPVMVWVTDPDGACTYLSQSWYDFTGQTPEGALGLGWIDAVHPDDREAAAQTFLAATARGEGFRLDYRLRRRDGVYRWAIDSARPRLGADGAFLGFIGSVIDITERKEAEGRNERIAETLQRSLLIAPDPARLPPGLDLGTEYLAAWDEALIGGDFFDAFALRGGQVALVVGDATGKGLAAAEHIAEVKYALRAFLREDPDPAAALGRLNRFACDAQALDPGARAGGAAYLAVAVAVLDPETGRGVCACAGMEPPLVLRRCPGGDGGAGAEGSAEGAEEVPAGGPLVGVEETVAYASAPFDLAPGDLLALTTDGVTEARAPGDRRAFFGPAGLAAALRAECLPGVPLAAVAGAAVARAVAFAGGRRADDMCLLLARRRRRGERQG